MDKISKSGLEERCHLLSKIDLKGAFVNENND